MIAFVLRRVIQAVIVMLTVGLVAFSLFRYVGDPVLMMVDVEDTAEFRAELRQRLGLNDPAVVQFSRFVWNTLHKRFYQRRAEWFTGLERRSLVMWWVEPGTRPTLAEALERLEMLEANGPTGDAFGWESLPQVEEWRTARCA